MKKLSFPGLVGIIHLLLFLLLASCSDVLHITENKDIVELKNDFVNLQFDLKHGTYDIRDVASNTLAISGAELRMNKLTSGDQGCKISWKKHKLTNDFGKGLSLDLLIRKQNLPDMMFSFILYEDHSFFDISYGIINNTGEVIQLKEVYVLADGRVYEGKNVSDNFAMVDGFSGGEPLEYGKRMYSPLSHSNALKSRNNILLTFGKDQERRTIVMGGLTYYDFEKFASISQTRRVELKKGADNQNSLLCYLNLPDDKIDEGKGGEILELVKGEKKRTWQYVEFRCTETATSVMEPDNIVIEARNLDVNKDYYLGFSWWRNLWHGNREDLWQSVFIEYSDNDIVKRVYLLDNHLMPRFDGRKKDDVEQVETPLPPEAIRTGSLKIVVEKPSGSELKKTIDENVYLSEIWLRDGSFKPLLTDKPAPLSECIRPRREFTAQLYAKDPVGKRVDPGTTYIPKDRFYLDVTTVDPFIALDKYGLNVSEAQNINLSMYDFPSVCLWYAENSGYGGSMAENTTLGAVREMEIIKESGFLKYSRAAVRLVPDSYMPDNQQGWWDDMHWQKEVPAHNGSKNGQYVEPYETSEKWGKAVTQLGGIPLTYFQTGFRSEDYAQAFPEHMLFNKTYAWKGSPQDTESELFSSWNQTWARNGRVWGYDYTDSDFIRHLQKVYRDLNSGGVRGLMFDYPYSGWASAGGMEDVYSTTAAAYRNIFKLPHDGLGPESYVHERNMQKGSDISIGLVASMRTENDTDQMDESTVTRCGLRWYKNRVLYNQDTDSKNIVHLEGNRDQVRAVLTMAYVVTGRLLLANSFSQFSTETFWDITRTFPYHTTNKSARPVDAFVADVPAVYDFEVNPQWHQVTFYNPDIDNSKKIGIDIAGQAVDGALNLNKSASYHVYDFWNDKYIGIISGSDRIEQELRPGEARMMSVREVKDHPQVISTNRHIMQGYLDMYDVEWDAKKKTLSGTSKVVEGDAYVIYISPNGFNLKETKAVDPGTEISSSKTHDGLIKITMKSKDNKESKWSIKFQF